jgi:spore cortex formation protein SpoVR/YcgB (stage V sporulation)
MVVFVATLHDKQQTSPRHTTETQLVRYDAMCRAIEACHSVDEVKQIRDQALALATYAQQAHNTDAERKATEIRVRAERRAGELLRSMKESGQRHTGHGDQIAESTGAIPLLSDLGITPDQSSLYRLIERKTA